MSHLQDKVIFITGGTSGIGEACTELFARQGAKVVTMSIQADEGKALAKKLTDAGLQCVFHYGDVSKEPEVKVAVYRAVSRFGRLDCVHANPGLLRNQKITDLTIPDFHAMVNVHVLVPVLVAINAIPILE